MTPYFIDSFAFGTEENIVPTVTNPLQKWANFSSGGSGSIQPGPVTSPSLGGGNCLEMGSAGFRQATMTHLLGFSPTTICVGFNFRNTPTTIGLYTLFRYEAGVPTLVNPGSFDDGTNTSSALTLIQQVDGSMKVYTGYGGTPNFPGTLLATLSTSFPAGTWFYVEVLINTSTGAWSVYVDDVLDSSGVTTLTGVDRYSFQQFSFESHRLANHYAADSRLGPCRVTGFAPSVNGLNQWTPLTPGPNLAMISEFGNRASITPDGDVTYNESSSAGQTDVFSWSKPACYGRILALAMNADAKAVSGTVALDLILKFRGVTYAFGSTPNYGLTYSMAQKIQELSLVSGARWTDNEIASYQFGYVMSGGGVERCTQIYLEKLVSLRSVSFECGGGSYSF